MTLSPNAQAASPRRGLIDLGGARRPTDVVALVATVFAITAAVIVHPHAALMFVYYLLGWNVLIFILHREQSRDFMLAFLVSSAFIGAFYLVQTANFPDAYGATSPLGMSWTDDTHFFSLAADEVPPGFPLRPDYFRYSHPFTSIIKFVTLPRTDHPMDVIFFQAGVTALISTFTKVFIKTLGGDQALARTAYLLTLVCPFMMMNGGVVLLRDTVAAAMLVYGLACWNLGKYPLAILAVMLQIAIRPGTGLILAPTYALFFFVGTGKRKVQQVLALAVVAISLVAVVLGTDLADVLTRPFAGYFGAMQLSGRDAYADFRGTEMNKIFLAILDLPVIVKFPLTAAYIFAFPFFSPAYAFSPYGFDLRAVTLNIIYPVYALWVNGWLIAGAITRSRVLKHQRLLVACLVGTFLLIGNYSLQGRHKTVLMPFIYVIAAVGMRKASPDERKIGFGVSFVMIAAEAVVAMR